MPRPPRAKPKYQVVLERLNQDIAAGRYAAGQKFPSEAALVKRFGVSRITVGHAVRELQRRGLLDRIAGSGTYVRDAQHHPAQGLLFGLIIPDLGETEIFEPICQAIAEAPDGRGHGLLWAHADAGASSREEQALQLCQQCIARCVSGVFFAALEMSPRSVEVNQRIMRMLKDEGISVVLLDRRPEDEAEGERSDLVGIDNHRAGYLATEHLVQLGAARVGFLAYGNQASTVRVRIAGYKDALSSARRAGLTERVFTVQAERAFELPPAALKCDGFVCANDRIAGNLMHYLLGRRVRIPQDIRIAGIDDVNYAALLPVPLTTVHQPCRDIGETALRVMLDRLGRPKMVAREILLDCWLVVRESCGAKGAELHSIERVGYS